jgi:SAM-dependent methyltransferase
MAKDTSKLGEIIREHVAREDFSGWFEALYQAAGDDPDFIPWAMLAPNPHLVEWIDSHSESGEGGRALKIGCGLGDDAEELARRGFDVLAFDISESAIGWCQRRFPNSPVVYEAHDLLDPPASWTSAFDFILEAYTLQVLPAPEKARAIGIISRLLAPGGTLLVVTWGIDPDADPSGPGWGLRRGELDLFRTEGLQEESFEEFVSDDKKTFKAVYRNATQETWQRRP